MKQLTIAVVGGGASGMLAAIAAARSGAEVTLYERNSKLGKKILATGNGRCNFMNIEATPNDYNHPSFVEKVFEQFGVNKTLSFFEEIGIFPKQESDGKMYPLSEQAQSFTLLLLEELNRLQIHIIYEAFIEKITYANNQFHLISEQNTYSSDRLILATGGLALPKSGSDGKGFEIAKSLKHHITETHPSLTKLKLASSHLRQLDGVKFPGTVELYVNDRLIQTETSDILFTKYGISGPGILQLSRKAIQSFEREDDVYINIIILDTINRLDIITRFKNMREKTVANALTGLIHQKLIYPIIKDSNIDEKMLIKDLSKMEYKTLLDRLFGWKFRVTGYQGYEDAQVTAGGIDTKEMSPHTLESRHFKGLYFCGEMIDIDAKCGGYNLLWAWASGYVAGIHASQ